MTSASFPHRCVLVIGATSGIGRALAQAIHDLPTKPKVIVTGRRKDRLQEITHQNASGRMFSLPLDQVSSRETLQAWVANAISQYPDVGRQIKQDLAGTSQA